MKLSLSN